MPDRKPSGTGGTTTYRIIYDSKVSGYYPYRIKVRHWLGFWRTVAVADSEPDAMVKIESHRLGREAELRRKTEEPRLIKTVTTVP